jgi:hypothetical protein
MSTLVVISYWSNRPPENLFNLLFQLTKNEQYYSYSICIVCNLDSDKEASFEAGNNKPRATEGPKPQVLYFFFKFGNLSLFENFSAIK